MPDKIKTLATLIANDLFTSGSGDTAEHAERLVLRIDTENRNLGGWSERAVKRRIEKMLREAGVTIQE